MNTKYKTRFSVMPYLLTAVLFTACSQDIEPSFVDTPQDMQTVRVRFNAYRAAFDGQDTDATRSGGSGTGWEKGETIYLRFDDGAVKGTAVFKSASNDWEVKLDGELSHAVSGKVEAYYFDKPISSTAGTVSLDATTGVYHATDGVYKTYANDDLDVVMTLKPITSRIRFAGNKGTGIEVEGLKYYTGYDVVNNQLTSSTADLSGIVAADGYTPYYYCEFAENNRQLSISIPNENSDYVKSFDVSVLRIGKSGYMAIPTADMHTGWTDTSEMEFTVTGNGKTVTFKMKKVIKGTFLMGQSADGDNETPVHSVTLTKDYYMGETEVTQGLWYAVMGNYSTTSEYAWTNEFGGIGGLGDNYPAYSINHRDCEDFIEKLNQITGQNFRLPTEAEWEFAAKGGNKSKGYIYAGGDNIEDVAWYSVNPYTMTTHSEGYGTHAVKTKAANEIGLYDMSGNVSEVCHDRYDRYPSDAQIDPIGSSGNLWSLRGGSWYGDSYRCRCVYRDQSGDYFHNFNEGVRLAL